MGAQPLDGSVEAYVEGEAEAVTRVERAIRMGPRGARVENVHVDNEEADGRLQGVLGQISHGPQTAHQARPRLPEGGHPLLRHHHAAARSAGVQGDDRHAGDALRRTRASTSSSASRAAGSSSARAVARAHRRRLHPDPQAGEAAGEGAQGELRPRVRQGRARDPRGRGRARGSGSSSWTTCWRPAGRRRRRRSW